MDLSELQPMTLGRAREPATPCEPDEPDEPDEPKPGGTLIRVEFASEQLRALLAVDSRVRLEVVNGGTVRLCAFDGETFAGVCLGFRSRQGRASLAVNLPQRFVREGLGIRPEGPPPDRPTDATPDFRPWCLEIVAGDDLSPRTVEVRAPDGSIHREPYVPALALERCSAGALEAAVRRSNLRAGRPAGQRRVGRAARVLRQVARELGTPTTPAAVEFAPTCLAGVDAVVVTVVSNATGQAAGASKQAAEPRDAGPGGARAHRRPAGRRVGGVLAMCGWTIDLSVLDGANAEPHVIDRA